MKIWADLSRHTGDSNSRKKTISNWCLKRKGWRTNSFAGWSNGSIRNRRWSLALPLLPMESWSKSRDWREHRVRAISWSVSTNCPPWARWLKKGQSQAWWRKMLTRYRQENCSENVQTKATLTSLRKLGRWLILWWRWKQLGRGLSLALPFLLVITCRHKHSRRHRHTEASTYPHDREMSNEGLRSAPQPYLSHFCQ